MYTISLLQILFGKIFFQKLTHLLYQIFNCNDHIFPADNKIFLDEFLVAVRLSCRDHFCITCATEVVRSSPTPGCRGYRRAQHQNARILLPGSSSNDLGALRLRVFHIDVGHMRNYYPSTADTDPGLLEAVIGLWRDETSDSPDMVRTLNTLLV